MTISVDSFDRPLLVSTSRQLFSELEGGTSPTPMPPRTDVVVAIWGDAFWSFFVDVSLPSQTGDESITAFKKLNAHWRFFCRPTEYERYRSAPSMQRLESHFTVEIIDLSSLERSGEFQYHLMTRCHQEAVCQAEHAMIFLSPDVVCSGSSYLNVTRLVERGARAVMCQGLRLMKESFVPLIRHECLDVGNMGAERLMEFALAHLHPMTKAFFVQANNETNHSLGSYMWIDHRVGILAHCYHLHPIFVWPDRRSAKIYTTVDHELVRLAVSDLSKIIVVDDSNDVLLCEISEKNHLDEQITLNGLDLTSAASWARDFAGGIHRDFFRVPIYFRHSGRSASAGVARAGREFVRKFLTVIEEEHGALMGVDMYYARAFYAQHGAYFLVPAPGGSSTPSLS